MFEWLDAEIAKIKTRRFHQVDGIASIEMCRILEDLTVPIPLSYKKFVLQFGNAQLYRQGSIYLVNVFASPREAETVDGELLLHFGHTDLSQAYFKRDLLLDGFEAPVFEWCNQLGLRKSAESFEDWLISKCKAARRLYKKRQWQVIENGPQPFTEQECRIIEARKKFECKIAGVASDGKLIFEVKNGSNITLAFLTVGLQGELRHPKCGRLNGGVWLPVASILPGQTQIIRKECYLNLIEPAKVEIFDQPDPGPEDRDLYWEFKSG